jgi:hypothetical protein
VSEGHNTFQGIESFARFHYVAPMLNIKFSYLYRDAANYKVYGSVVFSNPEKLSLPEIETQIRAKLIDGEFFDPVEWNVPRLQILPLDEELDHAWNEFESIEESDEEPNAGMSIEAFLRV